MSITLASTPTDVALAAISGVPALAGWPEEVRRNLAEAASVRYYRDGALILRAGDAIVDMRIVVQGALELRLDGVTGKRSVLSYTQPGECLGINCILDNSRPTYDLFAHGFTSLVQIPREYLIELFENDPKLLWAWVKIFAQRLKHVSDQVAYSVTSTLKQRLAYQIYYMSRGPIGPQLGRINLKVSQESLANILGTSRQNISKNINLLKRDGVIDYNSGYIYVKNIRDLERVFSLF